MRASYLNYFCSVLGSGAADHYGAYISLGLAPAFKVGSNPTPKPISELSVGSSVYAKESGTPAEFIVVHHGNPDSSIYDASCDGTWLLRNSCYDGNR